MNYLKKAAVCMTAAAMFAANSVGFMPYESIELLAITANAAEIVASGECGAEGDNVTWTLDSEGKLTISGIGEMDNWSLKQPWLDNLFDIVEVEIKSGVKSIGDFAFNNCRNMIAISIPDSITSIGRYAFFDCHSLTSIDIPDGVTNLEGSVFYECINLTEVTIPANITDIGPGAFEKCKNLNSITILNPDCKINDTNDTICNSYNSNTKEATFNGTIYGYTGSTAQEFAEKYNRTFIALDESPETAPVTTAAIEAATSTTTTIATTATKAATTTTTTKAKPVTTTVKTTALYPLTKVVTTTNSIHVDYAPELEYDDSPMKVGETRAIYVSDPTGKPVEDIKIMMMNDKISSSYEKGSNVLYITAVKPGKGSISLMIPGGSLTNGASFEIVEDTTVLTTTTVKTTTVVTTTATTTAPTPDVIFGDVDNNGIMDMSDASYIMAHYNAVACGQESPLTEAQQKAADTNGDGCINSYDAFIVSKIYAAIMTGMNVSDVPAYIAENFTFKCADSADGGYTAEEIAASSVKPTLSVADVEYKLDELAENGYIAEVTLSAKGFDEDVTAFDFHVYYDEGLTPYYTENNGHKNLKVSTMGGAAYCSLGKGFNEADNYLFISLMNRQKENLNGEMIKLYFNVPKDAQSGDKFKVYPQYTNGDVLVSGADNKAHAYLFTQGFNGGSISIAGEPVTTTTTTTTAATTKATTTTTAATTTQLGVVSTDCKIIIDTLPTKTIYNVGEKIDLDGGKISAFVDVTFTDGENVHGERINADVNRKNQIQVKHPAGGYIVPFVIKADTSAVDMSVPGEYTVNVYVLDAMELKVYTSETFNITVKEAITTAATTTVTTTTTAATVAGNVNWEMPVITVESGTETLDVPVSLLDYDNNQRSVSRVEFTLTYDYNALELVGLSSKSDAYNTDTIFNAAINQFSIDVGSGNAVVGEHLSNVVVFQFRIKEMQLNKDYLIKMENFKAYDENGNDISNRIKTNDGIVRLVEVVTTTAATTTATTTTATTTTTTTVATTTTTATTTTAPTTTTPPTTTEPYFVIGDVNEDGKVDSVDASLVLAEYALIQTGGELTFTQRQKNAADVNKDGKTDSSDASKILEYYAAISTGKDPSWD